MKKFYYTYRIDLLCGSLKGCYYFGQHRTDNLNDGYAGSGVKLQNYYKKYGLKEGKTFNKTILCFYSNPDELNEAEKNLIGRKYLDDPRCLNLNAGGKGNSASPEVIAKMVSTQIIKYGSPAGQMNTPEVKLKAKNATLVKYGSKDGNINSPESRAKAQKVLIERYGSITGQMNTPEVKDRNRKIHICRYGSMTGCMNTPEARQKSLRSRCITFNRKRSVCRSPEFIEWFKLHKESYRRPVDAVRTFLQEKKYRLDDYPETFKVN